MLIKTTCIHVKDEKTDSAQLTMQPKSFRQHKEKILFLADLDDFFVKYYFTLIGRYKNYHKVEISCHHDPNESIQKDIFLLSFRRLIGTRTFPNTHDTIQSIEQQYLFLQNIQNILRRKFPKTMWIK